MKKIILLLAFIFGVAVLFAAAQTNTFCASSLPCTVSGLWNFTGGLQNNGVAVPVLPINLASQVTGTLPGANYAAVNLAGGNTNGGVTGVLPGGNMAAANLASSGNGGVTGNLPVGNMNSGTGASSSTFWRGDGTWAAPAATGATTVLAGGCNGTASAGSTLTLFGLGNFSALTCTQSGVAGSIPMPSTGTLKNLRVVAVTGGVNASSGVVTVMDGGVSTGITCTLGTGTTCNDTTHTSSVAAGDLILIQFTTQGAETLAGVRATVEKQ